MQLSINHSSITHETIRQSDLNDINNIYRVCSFSAIRYLTSFRRIQGLVIAQLDTVSLVLRRAAGYETVELHILYSVNTADDNNKFSK